MEKGEIDSAERAASVAAWFGPLSIIGFLVSLAVQSVWSGQLVYADESGTAYLVLAILTFISAIGYAILDMKRAAYLYTVLGVVLLNVFFSYLYF